METGDVVEALGALAQDSRLAVFRLLVYTAGGEDEMAKPIVIKLARKDVR